MGDTVFTETFYMFCITSGIAFILALAKALYKSKCKEVSCCCMKIIRDTENEIEIDEIALQTHGTSSRDEKENSV